MIDIVHKNQGGDPTSIIVQETGQKTNKVMSQKAVTDLIGGIDTILDDINGEEV